MTDENIPKTDAADEAAPQPPAATPVEADTLPVRTVLEVNEATELSGSAEVAEIVPAAEVVHEVTAEAVSSPTPSEPAEDLLALPAAPEDEPVSAESTAPEPAEPTTAPDAVSRPTTEAEPPAAPAKKPRKSAKATTTAEPDPADTVPAVAPPGEPAAESKKKWYVVKIQSGREDSIKAAIERKVKIEGLEEFYGQIAIPVEEYQEVKKVTEKKNGERVTKEKKVVKHRKKFPGYLFAEVEYNDRILYLFRETSGVGDFVGASQHRAPTPMTDREVQSMLTGVAGPRDSRKPTKQVVKLEYEKGDKVKIRDGPFANMEGEVKAITEAKEAGETPKVTVEVTIFGRGVPVELDYWHVDKV